MTAPKMSEVFELPFPGVDPITLAKFSVTDDEAHAAIARAVNAHDALVEELRSCPCPRPANSRSDDFTTAECVDAGECGCSHGAALALAEGRS